MLTRSFSLTNILSTTSINLKFQKTLTIFTMTKCIKLATLLFHHVPEEQCITDDISSPHTLRFLDQAIEPFQAMLLPPDRCTLHGTSEEVEDSTNGTYVTMDVQLIPMRIGPLFLLRRRHANPKQIWVGSIDGINDSLVVLIRELRLIRRRISHHLQVRIIHGSTLHYQVEHLLRTTHKHHCTTLFLQLVHFEKNRSQPAILSLG